MTKNHNAVPKRKWQKWSELSRYTFNDVYSTMTQNPRLFLHPKAKKPDDEHWDTIAWNTAWIAADAARDALLAGKEKP